MPISNIFKTPPTRPISHLILDFDETITTNDTLTTLASASHLPNPNALFSSITAAYLADYKNHVSSHYPTPRTTYTAELQFLSSLKEVEQRSIERIEASNIFAGISPTDLQRAAGGVQLRDPAHLLGTIAHVLFWAEDAKVSIVSVNWSKVFIRAVLSNLARQIDFTVPEYECLKPWLGELERVQIYSNDLVIDPSTGLTTGKLDRYFPDSGSGIWTAGGKVSILDSILEPGQGEQRRTNTCNVVYIGDSVTDLPAMLHEKVDLGFVIGDNENFANTCERLGIRVLRKSNQGTLDESSSSTTTEGDTNWEVPTDEERIVYKAGGFNEVLECLSMVKGWK